MKKIAMFAMALAVVAMLTGCCAKLSCASKEKTLNGEKLTTTTAKDHCHLNGTNWGLYFFCWPICAGDTNNPGNSSKWFEDTVTLENVVSMVTKKAKDLGATKTVDMTSSVSYHPVFFNFKEINVSANAVD